MKSYYNFLVKTIIDMIKNIHFSLPLASCLRDRFRRQTRDNMAAGKSPGDAKRFTRVVHTRRKSEKFGRHHKRRDNIGWPLTSIRDVVSVTDCMWWYYYHASMRLMAIRDADDGGDATGRRKNVFGRDNVPCAPPPGPRTRRFCYYTREYNNTKSSAFWRI